MPGIFKSLTTIFRKPDAPQASTPEQPESAKSSPPENETRLASHAGVSTVTLTDAELTQHLSSAGEREVLRLLHESPDGEQGLRMVRLIADPQLLRKISRSQSLAKKLKRGAEQKLREESGESREEKLQRLGELALKMTSELDRPDWVRARELLQSAEAMDLQEFSADSGLADRSPIPQRFTEARDRLAREVARFTATCRELEEILAELSRESAWPERAFAELEARWKERLSTISVPKDFPLLSEREAALAARRAALSARNDAEREAKERRAREERDRQAQRKRQKDERADAERKKRRDFLDAWQARLPELEAQVSAPQGGAAFRELREALASLQPFRREFAREWDALDGALKDLGRRRTEALEEARWDTWARTDQALRIKGELEQSIGALEQEPEAPEAPSRAVALAERLRQVGQEMRDLGSLERKQDHRIWKEFKELTDRGWKVCEKTRTVITERLRALLTEHASRAPEFPVIADPSSVETAPAETASEVTAAAETSSVVPPPKQTPKPAPEKQKSKRNTPPPPRIEIAFKPSAFTEEVAVRLRELRMAWVGIGARNLRAHREAEQIFAQIFESYARERNLRDSRKRKSDQAEVDRRNVLLKEMRLAAEGKVELLARARAAKSIAERWGRLVLATGDGDEADPLAGERREFAGFQTLMNDQISRELESLRERISGFRAAGEELAGQVSSQDGAGLGRLQKKMTELDGALEKTYAYGKSLRELVSPSNSPTDLSSPPADALTQTRAEVAASLAEVRAKLAAELRARENQRTALLREAEALALENSADPARFEDLRARWKISGKLGLPRDAEFELYFENIGAFYRERSKRKSGEGSASAKKGSKLSGEEVLYALEALSRFKPGAEASAETPQLLPNSGKLLDFGLRFKQVLALDPAQGLRKETLQLMEQWSRAGAEEVDAGALSARWPFYLKKVRALLGIEAY